MKKLPKIKRPAKRGKIDPKIIRAAVKKVTDERDREMGEVLDFPDPYKYVMDEDNNIIGVSKDAHSIFNIPDSLIMVDIEYAIPKKDFKELIIMWLALNYPDCLKFDDLAKEENIRDETK